MGEARRLKLINCSVTLNDSNTASRLYHHGMDIEAKHSIDARTKLTLNTRQGFKNDSG